MQISDEQINEVKARIDIAELVSSYGFQVKQKGGDLWCCCPFHNEKTPSFKVDTSRGSYHCFGCGESGDAIDFVMKQEGLSFGDAVRKLADTAGVELKFSESPQAKNRRRLYELMSNLAVDFNKMLRAPQNKDGEPAREYLKKRQLDNDIVNKFLIGYAPKDVDKILAWAGRHGYSYQDLADAGIIKVSDSPDKKPYFYFANRLVFTIKDKNGQVVAFSGRQLVEDKKSGKYVNSPETLIFKKSRTFFAFDEARKNIVKAPNREAIICEGQIDCIRLHASGYNTAIAPLGTAFTEDHAVMLHRVADTVLLCFDDDGAGHKATIRTAQILLAEGMPLRVISLPDGDDPDSYILKHGKEAFGKLVQDKAESIVKFQIRAEQNKETNANDPNSAVRVTKAVLETISKSKDKVIRNVLLKEASKLLAIPIATLEDNISKQVIATEQEDSEEAEQLIKPEEPPRQTIEEDIPSITECAFINYLISMEATAELRACIFNLIPTDILHSTLAKKVMEAWAVIPKDDEDPIRDIVETMPINQYRQFVAIMVALDTFNNLDMPNKNKIVYFARQLWHSHLLRILKEEKDTNKKLISKAIKRLDSETRKGVVHLIQAMIYDSKDFLRTPSTTTSSGSNETTPQ